MTNSNKTALACAVSLLLSTQAYAGVSTADARAVAMAGTGVSNASYLTAPFHNPALAALYEQTDDFGLLLPGIGAQLNDTSDVLSRVDDAQDLYESLTQQSDSGSTISDDDVQSLDTLMDKLADAHPVTLEAAVGFAIAIPNRFLSVNLFADSYADIDVITSVASEATTTLVSSSSSSEAVAERYEDSELDIAGILVSEVGVSLARRVELGGQQLSFGLSPKIQRFTTYLTSTTLDDFSLGDYDDNKKVSSGANLDAGVVWQYPLGAQTINAGLAVKDIFERDVKTVDSTVKYQLRPKATAGISYSNPFFTAALDADINKTPRFTSIDDATQFVRVGMEVNAFKLIQLRGGFAHDMQNNTDDTFTAGLGFSPFDTVHFDLSASYAGTHELGAGLNLMLTL